jgi:hypothetical protein
VNVLPPILAWEKRYQCGIGEDLNEAPLFLLSSNHGPLHEA